MEMTRHALKITENIYSESALKISENLWKLNPGSFARQKFCPEWWLVYGELCLIRAFRFIIRKNFTSMETQPKHHLSPSRNIGRYFSGIKALTAVKNIHRSRYKPKKIAALTVLTGKKATLTALHRKNNGVNAN